MNVNSNKIALTAHWVNQNFKPLIPDKKATFGFDDDTPTLLFVGRLSREKGVDELAYIYNGVKAKVKNAKLVVAGNGPLLQDLKNNIQDATFLDWVPREKLPNVYSSADILILPSKFDTFSIALLEALSCGLPAVAYNTKGPKDIITHNTDGFLVNNKSEFVSAIVNYLANKNKTIIKNNATQKAKQYSPNIIVNKLLIDIGVRTEN
jgi:glycosyltransferase involved in cell wall biosynthesis